MKFLGIFVVFLITAAVAQPPSLTTNTIQELKRFAFGSCSKQYLPQPLWLDLIKKKPDLFIWGGDNVYANSTIPMQIEESYLLQKAHPDYALFKWLTPVIGIWDDHDYAFDNADGNYVHKELSQELFLDFLGVPKYSPRRFQPGIYTSYDFGPPDRRVKIILLDNRYFKDLDPAHPLLGAKQWEWLEAELRGSRAALNIIVAGLSILSPKMPATEEWEDYPGELKRMLSLFESTKPKGLLILSGDKHFSSIFQRNGHLEFMASGMTHNTRLPLRPYIRRMFDIAFFNPNYGLVDIDWVGPNPVISLSIQDQFGRSHHRKSFDWKAGNWTQQSDEAVP